MSTKAMNHKPLAAAGRSAGMSTAAIVHAGAATLRLGALAVLDVFVMTMILAGLVLACA